VVSKLPPLVFFGMRNLLVACLTVLDLRTAVCDALCKQDGYDGGSYQQKLDSCACSHLVKFEVATEKKTIIKPRRHRQQPPEPVPSGPF
jgi:hypothetical protein